jgi:hypothetical protein
MTDTLDTDTLDTDTLDTDNYNFSSKCMQPHEVNYVIYHGSCSDGFTAAMCCWYWRKLNMLSVDKEDITFFAGYYGKAPPDVTGKNVLLCDFSYKPDQFSKILSTANKVLILDHHKTAEEYMKNVDDINKVFDMNHCGAYITYRYFFGYSKPLPRMIKYVEYNDLWMSERETTRGFTAFMFSKPFEFEEYVKFMDDDYLDQSINTGNGMVLQNDSHINHLKNHIIPNFIQLGDMYYFAGQLCQSVLKSELGNTAFSVLPYLNFSVIYSHRNFAGATSYSLRSTDDRTDVSLIAKQFGGGGHKCASGCGISAVLTSLPCRIIDSHSLYYQLDHVYRVNTPTLKLVAFNCALYGKHIAKYLMQERVHGVQEGSAILVLNKQNDVDAHDTYDASVVYHISHDKSEFKCKGYIHLGNSSATVRNELCALFGNLVFNSSGSALLDTTKYDVLFNSAKN